MSDARTDPDSRAASADRRITAAAGCVIIILTITAFWLSYAHLHTVAAGHGLGGSPARAWAWPATLDSFIVAGELLMLRAALNRQTDPWAIGLTVVGSIGSIALNVFGVESSDPLAYVTAAVPPTAALLAFGALMRQVHVFLAVTDKQRDTAPDSWTIVPAQKDKPRPAVSAAVRSPRTTVTEPVRDTTPDTGTAPAAVSVPAQDAEPLPDNVRAIGADASGVSALVRELAQAGLTDQDIRTEVLSRYPDTKADTLRKSITRARTRRHAKAS